MRIRSIPTITILILAGMSFGVAARAATVPDNTPASQVRYVRVVRLSMVDGAVSIAHAGDSAWQPALANMPIQEGDALASANGFAEVEFENGCVAYLASNTTLQFTKLSLQDGGRITQMTLTQGTASFFATPEKQDSFEVQTPDLDVSIADRGLFRMDVITGGSSVSVDAGMVSVGSRGGTNSVDKGQTLTFRSEGNIGVSVSKNSEPDAFDHWVNTQTQTIRAATADSLSYVNSPYSYGMADLDGYGSWLTCPGIGTCWQPLGIGAGWVPYADGFWSPFDGLGMAWISYEPWGWMPYHFGSWSDSPMYGWVWAPGTISEWQPAEVAWVQSGGQVGWVPLAPNDRAGRPLANLQRAFVVSPAATAVGAAAVNHVAAVGNVSATVAMSRPPANFVSRTAPSMARTANPGAGPVVFDHATHAFVNAPASAGGGAPAYSGGARNTFERAPEPMAMPNRAYGGQGGGPSGGYEGERGGSGQGPSGGGEGARGNSAPMNSAPRGGSSAPAAAAPSAPSAPAHR